MNKLLTNLMIFFSVSVQIQAQDDFNQKFIRYLTTTLPENIYLQTDKPYYVVEDTIWLKAYAVNAQIHQPSPSNFVYVELINQLDSVQNRIKIRKDSTGFQGYLKLDKKLIPGEYALRAYTNWMRNESPEYFFRKNISICKIKQVSRQLDIEYKQPEGNTVRAIARYTYSDGSPIKHCRIDFTYNKGSRKYRKNYSITNTKGEIELGIRINENENSGKQQLTATIYDEKGSIVQEQSFAIPNPMTDFDVQFFPESGVLLAETPQIIAFKTIGSDGLSIPITGKVISEGGTTLAEIETTHNGMGKFPLWPQKDTAYYAIISNKEGIEKKISLPQPQAMGVTLHLSRRGSSCIYTFENKTRIPTDSLLLIAHTRGMVSTAQQLATSHKTGKFTLNRVPEGILNIAIADKAGNVLCERMMYVKKKKQPILQIATDNPEYSLRERVELHLRTGHKGDFALSVTDTKVVRWDSLDNNIISQLLLKSELRGHIETPGYYFTTNNEETNEHLDLLMLTQGWRRYDLSAILQQRLPEMKEDLERGQALTGRVKPILWRKLEKVEVIGFTNKWKSVHAKVDTLGCYSFEGIEFPDSTAFTINAVNKKGKAKGIMIYPEPERFPDSRIFIPNLRNEQKEKTEKQLNIYRDASTQTGITKEIRLDDISIIAKYISKTGKLAGEFAAYADHVVTEKTIEESYKNKSVANIIQESIISNFPGITMIEEGKFYYRGRPLHFVVDMRVISYDELQFYMTSEIASISFFKDASDIPLYVPVHDEIVTAQMNKYRGVILIELKNGATAHYYRPSLGLATLYPLGYQKPAEFYSPKYEVTDSLQNSRTDFRTTVYWNPCIQTDSTGYAKVSFYTTDMKHDMEYVLEGITEEGVPCRTMGRIKAKKD